MYNILIADDNNHIRHFLCRELSRPDYRIFEAANHMQLFSALYEEPAGIDLIVLEPNIPYLSGRTMLQRLQKARPSVPVILYSCMVVCWNDPDIRKTAGFVEKKSDVKDLKAKIVEVLQDYYAAGATI